MQKPRKILAAVLAAVMLAGGEAVHRICIM